MIVYPDSSKLTKPIIFDSHSHYDDPVFSAELDSLMTLQKNGGVYAILSCAVDKTSAIKTLSLADRYDFLYAAVGTHPLNIDDDCDLSYIYKFAKHKKCLAIGEIGLDYYYESESRDVQIKVFRRQIKIANELDLPVIVHDREAHADTLSILQELKPKGVVHCYSGSVEMAKQLIDLGMYIGVGGVVTFKNAKKLPDVVKEIPNGRLLIETDCPYLAPEPYRGKICHSGLIPFTAAKIAEILGTTTDDVLVTTCENAKRLFNII